MQQISISPKKIFLLLLIFVGSITAANIAGQYYKDFAAPQNPFILKAIEIIDFNSEKDNFVDWYQSSSLLFCAILLTIPAFKLEKVRRNDVHFWKILAWIFLYLSIEEAVNINNQIVFLVDYALNLHSYLYSNWLLTLLILVCLLFSVPLEALFRLPFKIIRLFICAGVIYVFGAVVLDMFGPTYFDLHNNQLTGLQKYVDSMFITTEESFEMIGVAIFIYALLTYLKAEMENKQIENEESVFQAL